MDEESVIEIRKFLGLHNANAPEGMRPGSLDVARDVDVDDAFAVRTRDGQTLVNGAASHSLWSKGDLCLVAQGVDLKRMAPDGSLTQLRRLTHAGHISYAELNGVVYFTNGADTGRVVAGEAREWGVRNPVGVPRAAATVGDLPPGTYQYAAAFLRDDGLESGAPLAGQIFLLSRGGLELTELPTSSDPRVVGLALYLSSPSGAELYRHHVVPAGTATAWLQDLRHGPALDPDLVEPAPPGQLVEVHAGVAYVADGHVAWASELHSLERFRRRTRFLQAPGHITLMGSVDDGMYLATGEETYYLAGNDPMTAKWTRVLDYGATTGTMVRFDVTELAGEDESPGNAVIGLLWAGVDSVIMGLPGGVVRNLTEEYSFQGGLRGAGLLRSARGYTSYVAAIQGAGDAPNEYS